MMRRLALLPIAVAALATACADQETTAPLRAPAGGPSLTLTPTADRTFAYVANTGSDNVSVIRTSDNTVLATVPVGDGPRGVAIAPSAARVYVANGLSDNVSVIQTSDNTLTATIPVGDNPQDLVVAPDGGRVYVTNSSDGSVSVIRTSDNTVVATIDVGDAASTIAITPNGAQIYVNSTVISAGSPPFGGLPLDRTLVIRTTDFTVEGTFAVAMARPSDVAITPDGSLAYVPRFTFPSSGSLGVIRTSDLTQTSVTLPGSPGGMAITPDGSYAYVVRRSGLFGSCGALWAIRTSDNAIVATVELSCFPQQVAITPDGAQAYVTNRAPDQTGNVVVVRTSDNTIVGGATVGASPDGVAIAFVPTPSQVVVASQDLVSNLDLAIGIEGSLLTKLSSALTAIEAGRIHGACGALQDFVSQVMGLSGKKISTADAILLIDMANQARELIGC
jgi:YVTN family beta-propeller protein